MPVTSLNNTGDGPPIDPVDHRGRYLDEQDDYEAVQDAWKRCLDKLPKPERRSSRPDSRRDPIRDRGENRSARERGPHEVFPGQGAAQVVHGAIPAMNLHVLDIPDDPTELAPWLDRLVVGPDLGESVAACRRDPFAAQRVHPGRSTTFSETSQRRY